MSFSAVALCSLTLFFWDEDVFFRIDGFYAESGGVYSMGLFRAADFGLDEDASPP